MRLLVDEMFAPVLAQRLGEERGADAVSVLERDDLRGCPDTEVFVAAQREQRAIVTENARDYRPIARDYQAAGQHFGLVLTSNRKYPRAQRATLSRLFGALVDLLDGEEPDSEPSNREIWI